MKRCILTLVIGFLALWTAPACRAHESLERALMKQAPKLIRYFKEQGYRNVGVLKFVAAKEGNHLSDNVGTLNMLNARRLELSLILANDPQAPVNIISNASEVARKIPGANHLDAEGRRKLFAGQYPLAWGKETVQPDAFVTGLTQISKDLRTLTITLCAFDRTKNKLVPVSADLVVANPTSALSEMGESFMLRGAFDGGSVKGGGTTQTAAPAKKDQQSHQEHASGYEQTVYKEAAKVYEQKVEHPVQHGDQRVTLEVFYDNQKINCEIKNGKAFIPEPREGQKVHFHLSRDGAQERYGVVLKVNGENTLDKQRLPDISCRKWILDPGQGPWAIGGYQIGSNNLERFRVASVPESKRHEFHYGSDVGTITMTVFCEQRVKAKPRLESMDEEYQRVVKAVPETPAYAKNFGALKAQLLYEANEGGGERGLILGGPREKSEVQTVSFVADPNPVMAITIVYYRR